MAGEPSKALLQELASLEDQARHSSKVEEIEQCLNGTSEQVDLWRLRSLALSRGGLMSSALRKRAWPKLVQAQVVSTTTATEQEASTVSTSSMQLLLKDVTHSVWHVQEHMDMAKQQREKHLSQERPKTISFAPDLMESDSAESQDAAADNVSTTTTDNGSIIMSVTTTAPDEATLTSIDESLKTNDTHVPKRRSNPQEMKLLFNIIISVLRTVPSDSPYFQDDRYKYYRGMADVAALLLISLESPSLTSLVLNQLAPHHLRDALRSDSTCVAGALELTFMPLMQRVDAALYQHLTTTTSSQTFPKPLLAWIHCWFCQQFPDVNVASRLVDVFVVSHALMPIYFSVAFLVRHRDQILATPQNPRELNRRIRKLPLDFLQQEEGVMDVVEDLIATSLKYMTEHPPSSLLQDQTATSTIELASISMIQSSPSWATAPTAPTDYALLTQAKQFRETGQAVEVKCRMDSHRYHALAVAAVGGGIGGKRRSRWWGIPVLLLVCVLGLVAVAYTGGALTLAAPEAPVVPSGRKAHKERSVKTTTKAPPRRKDPPVKPKISVPPPVKKKPAATPKLKEQAVIKAKTVPPRKQEQPAVVAKRKETAIGKAKTALPPKQAAEAKAVPASKVEAVKAKTVAKRKQLTAVKKALPMIAAKAAQPQAPVLQHFIAPGRAPAVSSKAQAPVFQQIVAPAPVRPPAVSRKAPAVAVSKKNTVAVTSPLRIVKQVVTAPAKLLRAVVFRVRSFVVHTILRRKKDAEPPKHSSWFRT